MSSDGEPRSSILKPLISASSCGDLAGTRAILEQWQASSNPIPERPTKEPNDYLQPALEASIRRNKLNVVDYLLKQDFRVSHSVVKTAIRTRSIAALELFVAHGWDINNRRRCPYVMPCIGLNFQPFLPDVTQIQLTD